MEMVVLVNSLIVEYFQSVDLTLSCIWRQSCHNNIDVRERKKMMILLMKLVCLLCVFTTQSECHCGSWTFLTEVIVSKEVRATVVFKEK